MSYSLLYKIREDAQTSAALYDLSADRIINTFCFDKKRADFFMDILSRPLFILENIIYRQQILSDLRLCPGLFEDLQSIFTRYDKIKNDWRELKSSNSAYANSSDSINPEALLERTFASLKITAMFPNTIVSFYSSLLDTLNKYNLTSEGLLAMRGYCSEMLNNNSLSEIVRISQLFQYKSPEFYSFGVLLEYDATLRLRSCGLSEIIEKAGKQNAFAKLFSRKKPDDDSVILTSDNSENNLDLESDTDMTSEDVSCALNEALTQIDAALTQITDAIYINFYGLSRELMFYEAALQFYNFARERSLILCTPKILPAESNIISLINIRDLVLASEG